ncbi:Oidioi.mRNA.OKI2018_I69.XSR.g16186.t1.cds [Oikopleura dioica]|uniref:Oidioi.mRNA.OKI2018_I69.XSR.g16186.t1.cds n=1 Tax=Oikopleura dioica TaxID=34765 RepID=A0ABN7SLM1_OIKDI|nr:Oidioi.mRNA.OKI2018_I69.XSR.g16186.t1.cds [Oikopleura dioica]
MRDKSDPELAWARVQKIKLLIRKRIKITTRADLHRQFGAVASLAQGDLQPLRMPTKEQKVQFSGPPSSGIYSDSSDSSSDQESIQRVTDAIDDTLDRVRLRLDRMLNNLRSQKSPEEDLVAINRILHNLHIIGSEGHSPVDDIKKHKFTSEKSTQVCPARMSVSTHCDFPSNSVIKPTKVALKNSAKLVKKEAINLSRSASTKISRASTPASFTSLNFRSFLCGLSGQPQDVEKCDTLRKQSE